MLDPKQTSTLNREKPFRKSIEQLFDKKVLLNVIDFGFAGGILLRQNELLKQKKSDRITQFAEGYGKVLEGAYGQGQNAAFYISKVENIEIGDLLLNERIVETHGGVGNTFGLEFFRNYRVIMNWDAHRIKLIETSPYKYKG